MLLHVHDVHPFTHTFIANLRHVSGLLHALVAMCPSQVGTAPDSDTEESLPITSYPCKWTKPRKRKDASMKMSEIAFQKHVYGRQIKHTLQSLSDFDPRPFEHRGTVPLLLKEFVTKVKGKGLGISVLFDKDVQVWTDPDQSDTVEVPSKSELIEKVSSFKQTLRLTSQQIRELERQTKDQHNSSVWFSARRFRLTASMFGRIFRMLPKTHPDSLVKQLLHPKDFSTKATEWGNTYEPVALEKYCEHQAKCGHNDIITSKAGFVVCEQHPFLGASPDSYVFDPSSVIQFGLVEIKCPYKYRERTPEVASQETDFCCRLHPQSDGTNTVELKRTHAYYCQVQGQLAITERKWCDFVVFTKKEISVERIQYDSDFWENELLPKLTSFYDNCLCPSIVSPIHLVGMKAHDLR